MLRVGLAPCSPFSVTPDLMRETADLARSLGVHLHTHLAETLDEERFCLETVGSGRSPIWSRSAGWAPTPGSPTRSISTMPRSISSLGSGSRVAHCPTSNMRLSSGIAPLQRMRAAGVRVGLGVDGSASNPDGSNLLAEARQALLLARLEVAERQRRDPAGPASAPGVPGGKPGDTRQMRAREALETATLGGAAVPGAGRYRCPGARDVRRLLRR